MSTESTITLNDAEYHLLAWLLSVEDTGLIPANLQDAKRTLRRKLEQA